jgi:hypothetical protein
MARLSQGEGMGGGDSAPCDRIQIAAFSFFLREYSSELDFFILETVELFVILRDKRV